jgi:hypothetical protein
MLDFTTILTKNLKGDPYAEYYRGIKDEVGGSTKKIECKSTRLSNCPHCSTVGRHLVIEKKSRDSIIECLFCYKTFGSVGNCR